MAFHVTAVPLLLCASRFIKAAVAVVVVVGVVVVVVAIVVVAVASIGGGLLNSSIKLS